MAKKQKSLDELFMRAVAATSDGSSDKPSRKRRVKKQAQKHVFGAKKLPKVPKKADFDDEDDVLREMALALDVDADDLSISESKNLSSFRVGTFYEVESGRETYIVARDEDEARELALAVVKQDLEHEPEIFSKDFIERHINTDRLRNDLMSDVQSSIQDDLEYEAGRDAVAFAREHDLEDEIKPPTRKEIEDAVGEDEEEEIKEVLAMDPLDQWEHIREEPEIPSSKIEEIAEEEAKRRLKDPMEYLEDIYGKSEAVEQAIKIAGIDEDAAAEEAVDSDGWEHFLARYDGTSDTTDSGFVYWRQD